MKKSNDEVLNKWKDSNYNNDYQKMIATKEFLHDNSKKLVEVLQENNVEFKSLVELGCGMARNIYYIKKSFPNATYSGNDLSREQCYKFMDDSVKDMKFFENDTLNFVKYELSIIPDAVLDSDHLMHLPPDSVGKILETIADGWNPKYFITRRPTKGRLDSMPYIWLHDYSVFEDDYDLTSVYLEESDYVIDIYKRII